MSDYDGNIVFKEWLPDLPDLNNPGLTEALNLLRIDGKYTSYSPHSGTGNALAETASAALRVNGGASGVYVGTTKFLYYGTNAGGAWTSLSASTFNAGGTWSLAQYGEKVIATNGIDTPQLHTLGASSNFATIGGAPLASVVGIIGQFVVLGNLSAIAQYAVQWSGIDAPTSWPTPSSATAVAQQSGRQYLHAELGFVAGVSGGDQAGLILMNGGIVRATYTGGSTVFQFDTIYRGPGPIEKNAWVKAENLVYFASYAGFFVTDGVVVKPIGHEKVDRYFLSNYDQAYASEIRAAYDFRNRQIYWTFPKILASGAPNEVLAYSIDDGTWTHCSDTVSVWVQGGEAWFNLYGFQAIGTNKKIGKLAGTPGTALITTGETEPNPGGFSRMQGIKPLVDVTIGAVTVAMGTRNDLTSAVSYTSEVTANSRSGFCNFRSEARYHRSRMTIAGTFNAAQGLEYEAVPTGFT